MWPAERCAAVEAGWACVHVQVYEGRAAVAADLHGRRVDECSLEQLRRLALQLRRILRRAIRFTAAQLAARYACEPSVINFR